MSITVSPPHSLLTSSKQNVNLCPMPSELTVVQAAKFLNASEGYVNEILDAGLVAFRLESGERMVQWDGLKEFGQKRERMREGLAEMVRWNQEMGLYDD